MLEYEPWGNSSQMMLNNSDEVPQVVGSGQNSNNHGIDSMFNTNDSSSSNNNNNSHGHHSAVSLDYAHHHHANFSNNNAFSQHQFFNHQAADHHQTSNLHNQLYVDPRAFSSSYAPHHHFDNPLAGLNINSGAGGGGGGGYFLVPKTEEGVGRTGTRIGLNLGHRTYFSAQDDDFVNRLYRRPRPGGFDGAGSVNSPRCQAEGCAADLSNAKHYHRRHKVCEFHSKAATVIAGGLTQRFCQQCSRFHLLTEFDNGKRSCRKRLADHNRRRRKTPQLPTSQSQLEHHEKSPVETSFNNLESPPESSAMTHSSSSVTIAISPPRMTLLECFRQRSYRDMASASSSSSVFYSN